MVILPANLVKSTFFLADLTPWKERHWLWRHLAESRGYPSCPKWPSPSATCRFYQAAGHRHSIQEASQLVKTRFTYYRIFWNHHLANLDTLSTWNRKQLENIGTINLQIFHYSIWTAMNCSTWRRLKSPWLKGSWEVMELRAYWFSSLWPWVKLVPTKLVV